MSQMQDMIPGSPIRTARRKLNLSNEKSRKKSQKRNNKRREKAKANKNSKLSEEKNSSEIGETSKNTTSRNEINSELNNTEPSNISKSKISTNDIENMSAAKTIDETKKIDQCNDNSSNNIENGLNETVKSEKIVKKRRLGYGRNNSAVELSNLDGKSPRRKILGNNSESNIKQIKENEDQKDTTNKMSVTETKEKETKIEYCEPDWSEFDNQKDTTDKMSVKETKEKVIKVEHCEPGYLKFCNPKKYIETNILMEKNLNDTFYDLSSIFESSFTQEIENSNQKNNADSPNTTIVNMNDTSCVIKSEKSNLDDEFDELDDNMLLNILKEDQVGEVEQSNNVEVPSETNEPNILETNKEKPDFIGFQTAGFTKIPIPESKLENAIKIYNNISHEIDVERSSSSLSASTLTVTDTNTITSKKLEPEQHIFKTPNNNRNSKQNLDNELNELDDNMLLNILKGDQINELEQSNNVEVKNETNEPNILERNEESPEFFGFETAGDTKITIPESKLDNALVNNNEISHEIDTENTGNSSDNIEKVSPKKLNKVPINQSVSLSASTLTVTDTNTTLSTESGRYNLRSRKNTPNQKNQNRLSLKRKRLSDISTPKQCSSSIRETFSTPDFNKFCGVLRTSTPKGLQFRENIKRENSKENVNHEDVLKLYVSEENSNVLKYETMEIEKTSSENKDNLFLKKTIDETNKFDQCNDNSSNNIENDLNEIVKSEKIVKKRRLGYGRNNSAVEISNLDGKSPRRKILGNHSESNIKQIKENEDQKDTTDKMSVTESKEKVIKIEHCEPDWSEIDNQKDTTDKMSVKETKEKVIKIEHCEPDWSEFHNQKDTTDKMSVTETKEKVIKIEHCEPDWSEFDNPENEIETNILIEKNLNDTIFDQSSIFESSFTEEIENSKQKNNADSPNTTIVNMNDTSCVIKTEKSNLDDEFDELDDNMLLNILKEDQVGEVEQSNNVEVPSETNEPNILETNEVSECDISGIGDINISQEIQFDNKTSEICVMHDTKQIKSVSNNSNCDTEADIQNCDINNIQNIDVEKVNEISNESENYQKSNILSTLKFLRERESKKVVSINHTGSLFWKRRAFKRVSVYNFIKTRRNVTNLDIMSLKKAFITNKRFLQLSNLNYSNALSFKFEFSNTDYYPIMLVTNDETIIIPDNDFQIGFNEIKNSFRTIISSKHSSIIRDNWIENHYRQILLKLSNFEIEYPDVFLNYCCLPEIVLQQLKYRYDIEFDLGRKSCLETFILSAEKNKIKKSIYPMVLIVTNIVTDDENNIELFLSDRWYVVKTSYDPAMKDLIIRKKVRVGMKLYIENAEIINEFLNDNNDDFMMLLSKVKLRFHTNSTRRAKFDTKLGYMFKKNTLDICLDSVNINGGIIAGVTLVVDKIYSVLREDQNDETTQMNFDSNANLNPNVHSNLPKCGTVWERKEVVSSVDADKNGKENLKLLCHDAKKSNFQAVILIYNINDQHNEIKINSCINVRNVRIHDVRKDIFFLVHYNESTNNIKILP